MIEEGANWGFGALWLRQRDRCGPDCKAPVFELVSCSECGAPHLVAGIEHGLMSCLTPRQVADFDDFEVDREPDANGEESEEVYARDTVWLRPASGSRGDQHLRCEDGVLFENGPPDEGWTIALHLIEEESARACCARAGDAHLMPQRYGPAFLMGNAIPMLLESLAPPGDRAGLPMGGRRTLTFSDSRQGTARLAARLQQEAERHLTRAFIYHSVQQGSGPSQARLEEIENKLAVYRQHGEMFAREIADLEAERSGGPKPVLWPDLVNGLARHPELEQFATDVWKGRKWYGDEMSKDPHLLANMFLARELLRRPRVQNNAETMGLARLSFPNLEAQARVAVPGALIEAGVDDNGWVGLVQAAVDLGFRDNLAVEVSPGWIFRWASPRGGGLNAMVRTGTPPHERPFGSRAWPSAVPGPHTPARLVRLVYAMIAGSPDNPIDQARAREVLDTLWNLISQTACISAGLGNWRLDFRKAAVSRVRDAWLCPVTRRVLGYSTGGPSPYGTEDPRFLEPLQMPMLPEADPSRPSREARDRIEAWLKTDPAVAGLRGRGVWSDLHDRIGAYDPFLRAQEHSAQIPRPVLKSYEQRFKDGEINILNCSTTMEMGVDIPDIAMVVNANLPPSISNYRQRVGRAGRRGEPWAFGVTFCRDLPLDWAAYEAPERFLTSPISAPAVRLDSQPVVSRHVNAALLAAFLRNETDFKIQGSAGPFFGAQTDPAAAINEASPADAFLAALRSTMSADPEVAQGLDRLTRGTVLEGRRTRILCADTARHFEEILQRWRREYSELVAGGAAASEKEVQQSYTLRAGRMAGEFLIGELARRGFTPAYGFPVDVVSFDHLAGTLPNQGENVLTFGERRGGASRTLDVAIREYAPGAEIVLDGLVHTSEGVQPAWSAMADASGLEDIQSLWECERCRSFAMTRRSLDACPNCDAPAPRTFRVLRPAGFLGRKAAHTGYERLAQIPFEAPKVSAAGGPWLALADPGAGRIRGHSGGTVVTLSAGATGMGFALCLSCGRAVSETDDTPGSLAPELMRKHTPLAPSRGAALVDGNCPGGFRDANRIQRHLRLGHEALTDVFEFQAPVGHGRAAVFGLAAALREALAERLGVEAREVGLSAAESVGPAGENRFSAILFDRAAGGAGLSTRLAEGDWFEAAMTAAIGKLDCPEECKSGCPACVLRQDISTAGAQLARPEALALARSVGARLGLPPELLLFGPETKLVGTDLVSNIDGLRTRGQIKSLHLWLGGNPATWDLSGWPAEDLIARLSDAGVEVEISIPAGAMEDEGFDASRRMDLYRMLVRGGARLTSSIAVDPCPGGFPIIATLVTSSGISGFAARNPGANAPGPDWASSEFSPVVMGPVAPPPKGDAIDVSGLLERADSGNSHLIWVGQDLDGTITGFGRRFWQKIQSEAAGVFKGLELEGVVEACYTDRYLQTPLNIRLLAEMLSAIPGADRGCRFGVRTSRNDGRTRSPWAVFHNYEEDAVRQSVIEAATGSQDVRILDRRSMPHPRSLELRLGSGRRVRILLDQGLGAWRAAGAERHNFGTDPERQAAALAHMTFRIQADQPTGSPIIVEFPS